MARILAPGGHVIMVNDNVRYAGEEVPVDLILGSMAEGFGLQVERIWTIARGKATAASKWACMGAPSHASVSTFGASLRCLQ